MSVLFASNKLLIFLPQLFVMKILKLTFQILAVLLLLKPIGFAQQQNYNDATLASVRAKDSVSRAATGKISTLTAAEHIFRADVYMSNRAFPEAREHYQKIAENFPGDAALMPRALFGIARSQMWEKNYQQAVKSFDALIKNFPYTKDGREGLAFKGASLVRLGKAAEAAEVYEQYTIMFPTGERVESSHLNIIDALREAKKFDEAAVWVDKTRQKFPGTATETNAVFARLRMEIGRKSWGEALKTADELRLLRPTKGAMTNQNEIGFLRAFVLEKLNRKDEAIAQYFNVPDALTSYYGWLSTERLVNLVKPNNSRYANLIQRQANIRTAAISSANQFPALFTSELNTHAAARRVDPRFVLAIMKQESSFNQKAKSPAAARGLLQLTSDTAAKYTTAAKISVLQPEDLYRPNVNIALGSVYLAELQKMFPNLPEAVAASYNGGEENAERWRQRADAKEPFLFAAEVGFAETKDYVFKVLGNYRAYREIYTENLQRK